MFKPKHTWQTSDFLVGIQCRISFFIVLTSIFVRRLFHIFQARILGSLKIVHGSRRLRMAKFCASTCKVIGRGQSSWQRMLKSSSVFASSPKKRIHEHIKKYLAIIYIVICIVFCFHYPIYPCHFIFEFEK